MSQPVYTATRLAVRLTVALTAVLALLAVRGTPARASQGDSYAGLFVGTTTFGVSTYTTHGAAFGGSYGYQYANDRLWMLGATFASTNGTTTDSSGNTLDLSANGAEFSLGLLSYFEPESAAARPFLGTGVSVLSYQLDFTGTSVGKTSNVGPGVYGTFGVELRLTRNFTVIPEFGLQAHSIRTEAGAITGLLSGGLQITMRITD